MTTKEIIITSEFGKPIRRVSIRCGSKVAWIIVPTKREAEIVSRHAKKQAIRYAAAGYDFGYCCPGTIEKVETGYEICLP